MMTGDEPSPLLRIPPAWTVAEFPWIVHLVISGDEFWQSIPPPHPSVVLFSAIVQSMIVKDDDSSLIPPPLPLDMFPLIVPPFISIDD